MPMKTYDGLFLLFLGFGGFALGRSSILCLGFAIGLSFSDLARDGPRATPAWAPARFSVSPLAFFLISWLCDFDNDRAAIELLLVEKVDGLLGSFGCRERNKRIARRTSAAHYNLGGHAESTEARPVSIDLTDMHYERKKDTHVALNGLEKRLQPFIRSGIRKISDEDL
jgi:hypothetical protein